MTAPSMTVLWEAGPARPDAVSADALDEIDRRICRLFALVVDGLSSATAAFVAGDRDAASRVVTAEVLVDRLHLAIEDLLEQQLASVHGGVDADGLARLVLALRIVPELERSGDLVEHIAARASVVTTAGLPAEVLELVGTMSDLAVDLWHRAAGAFGGVDGSTTGELRLLDDQLDDAHVRLCAALAALPLPVAVAIELGLVARFYERLGDHAVNVARRVDEHDRRSSERRTA